MATIGRFMAYREEARSALPALKAVAEHPAGEAGVRAVVGKRFAIYRQPVRDDAEWACWWDEYVTALSDVPLASLEAGMRAWVAAPDSKFLPTPGEFREMALKTPSRSIQRYQRARAAVEMGDEQRERERVWADIARRGSSPKEQAEAIRGMLGDVQAELAAGAKRDREAMFGKGMPFANRVRIPQGPLNETQKRMLRACGITV